MWRRMLVVLMLVSSSCSRSVPPPDPGPGIPLALATDRARTIRNVRYALTFDIPATQDAPVMGRVVIAFTRTSDALPVVLDFAPGAPAIHSVSLSGTPVAYRAVNDHIVIAADVVPVGTLSIEIEFEAGDAALNRDAELLYTLFVPARAHLTFPCFDQPDLKARFAVTLSMPDAWTAVTNGAETAGSEAGGRRRTSYAETQPIPTYLFAFAAGRFQVETEERRGRLFRMLHRETDAKKVARNRDALFGLHATALAWLEEYSGIAYPFGKFDFVLLPAFQFSGMEHPGAVYYNAPSLLLEESATENQILNRALTISHETAHMWFGDLVTMRWFDDVWMKEVFANFIASKIVNPSFPDVNHELRFLTSHYPQAYSVDRTAGTHPIRQALDNLSDAGSQYGAIIYQKAPIVMRQLEQVIGETTLRDGLRAYLREFQFGNATWLDLVRVLDARTNRDVVAWSRAWVEESGRPTIRTRLTKDPDGRVDELAFEQEDGQAGRGLVWEQELSVAIGVGTGVRRVAVGVNGPRVVVPEARGLPDVRFVSPTGGGLAYGEFVLDSGSREYLLARVHDLDALTRGAVWVTLWEEVLDRRVTPHQFVDAVLAALPREAVQQNAQLSVGYLREAYWHFLSATEREALAPRVERAMRAGLRRASTPSERAIYFGGVRSMALTPEGVDYLERVWSQKERVPGLPLAESDEATLALELAVRDVPNAARILETQRRRFQNPDRQARFEFVMPALSGSAAVRERFFSSLSDLRNRRREPWVLEATAYLHHPLRAEQSAALVRPALELLQPIQQTGDIFFPRNWMVATLAGHQSKEVAMTVRTFLDEQRDYPMRLRRIVLQAADDLFRASGMRDVTGPSVAAGGTSQSGVPAERR